MHNILKQTNTGWQIAGTSPDLEKLLLDPTLILSAHGRINLHYTCHHVLPEGQRSFSKGEWLFFDIDDIEEGMDILTFSSALEQILGAESWLISSGNGAHILFRMLPYSESYLEVHKSTYAHIAKTLQEKLSSFSFKIDPVFHKSKSLRMPGTINRKEGKEDKECKLIRVPSNKQGYDLLTIYRLTYDPSFDLEKEIKKADDLAIKSAQNHASLVVHRATLDVNPIADKSSILEKCGFMSLLEKELANLPRNEWFKGVSLLTTLNMEEEAHQWSSSSPLYKPSEVDSIIEGVKQRSLNTFSCETIKQTFPADITSPCDTCTFKSCKSPANLHNDPLLSVMGAGFKYLPEGAKKPVTDYDSISQFMSKYLSTIYIKDRKSFYMWEPSESLYKEKTEAELTNIACQLIKPRVIDPQSQIAKISGAIEVNASREEKTMLPQDGTVPLANGLFSIQSGTLEPYSPKVLTINKLPFAYDPLATCPNFDKFLEERIGDQELIDSLMLFLCYAMAGIRQPIRKILVLEGPAATGKSTLLTVISRLFGDLCFFGQLQNLVGRFETASFVDKRVILFDEALSARDQTLIEVLKNLSGSETIKIEKKGKDPQNVANFARIVIACNEIPRGGSMDSGFMDRLLIIPMHNVLEYAERDYNEVSAILSEGSGVLNKVVSYYNKLKELNFIIPQPRLSMSAIESYQENDNSLVTFIKSECELVPLKRFEVTTEMVNACHRPDASAGISLKDLRKAVQDWANEEGESYLAAISARGLAQQLENLAKTTYKGKIRSQLDKDNRKYFLGITLKDKSKHSTLAAKKKDAF